MIAYKEASRAEFGTKSSPPTSPIITTCLTAIKPSKSNTATYFPKLLCPVASTAMCNQHVVEKCCGKCPNAYHCTYDEMVVDEEHITVVELGLLVCWRCWIVDCSSF
jgi:hypothetical protein